MRVKQMNNKQNSMAQRIYHKKPILRFCVLFTSFIIILFLYYCHDAKVYKRSFLNNCAASLYYDILTFNDYNGRHPENDLLSAADNWSSYLNEEHIYATTNFIGSDESFILYQCYCTPMNATDSTNAQNPTSIIFASRIDSRFYIVCVNDDNCVLCYDSASQNFIYLLSCSPIDSERLIMNINHSTNINSRFGTLISQAKGHFHLKPKLDVKLCNSGCGLK